jgi:hypothetical protein
MDSQVTLSATNLIESARQVATKFLVEHQKDAKWTKARLIKLWNSTIEDGANLRDIKPKAQSKGKKSTEKKTCAHHIERDNRCCTKTVFAKSELGKYCRSHYKLYEEVDRSNLCIFSNKGKMCLENKGKESEYCSRHRKLMKDRAEKLEEE